MEAKGELMVEEGKIKADRGTPGRKLVRGKKFSVEEVTFRMGRSSPARGGGTQ